MLRSAPLHYAGRSASVSRPAHKLGSLPLAEIEGRSSAASQRLSASRFEFCSVATTERPTLLNGRSLYNYHTTSICNIKSELDSPGRSIQNGARHESR